MFSLKFVFTPTYMKFSLNLLKLGIIIFYLFFAISCRKECKSISQNSWKEVFKDQNVSFSNIAFYNDKVGFILADNKNVVDTLRGRQFVFKTIDGGSTWTKIACKFPTVLDGARLIASYNENSLVALQNHLFKSLDNGLTWYNIDSLYIGSGFFSIHIIDSLNWILAEGNDISRTIDGGEHINKVFLTDFGAPFTKFTSPTANIIYASGSINQDTYSYTFIAKSIDTGLTWNLIEPNPWHSSNSNMPGIYSIQFITADTGFIFTQEGKLFKTTDGGYNWSIVFSKGNLNSSKCYFLNSCVGYYIDQSQIYYTTNGGMTWIIDNEEISKNTNAEIIDIYFQKQSFGIAITSDSEILIKYISN